MNQIFYMVTTHERPLERTRVDAALCQAWKSLAVRSQGDRDTEWRGRRLGADVDGCRTPEPSPPGSVTVASHRLS